MFFKKRDESEAEKIDYLEKQFNHAVGYWPNITSPKSFNEKIQWLKMYYHHPLLTIGADKYAVRQYVTKMIGDEYLIPLLGVYKKSKDVKFDKLPNKFVLKANNGSGTNIICSDKSILDIEDATKKLDEWLKPNSGLYRYSYEWCYKNIKPLIVCEKYMDGLDGDLLDYKFMCFNGNPELLFVCSERTKGLKIDFFDMSWRLLPFTRKYPNNPKTPEKPNNFDLMVDIAKKLSQDFPFVRVDLYEVDGRVYFGELTFYPGNGMEAFDPVEWDYKIGDLLRLPKKVL